MEIDSVKQKLREEASRERAEIKRATDDSLRQERLKSDAQLESLHRSVAKTEEDCQTLRREVEALRVRVFSRQSELSDVQCELDEVTKRLRLVGIGGERSQDSGEALFDFETTLEGALLSKRESLESWVAELREAVERERERKDSSRAEFQDRVRERRAGMAVGISLPSSAPPLTLSLALSLSLSPQSEISRIESKIATLLRGRDSALCELRRCLAEAQERNRDLEEQLDEDRGRSIGGGRSGTSGR